MSCKSDVKVSEEYMNPTGVLKGGKSKTSKKRKSKNKQKGGEGYTVNPGQVIVPGVAGVDPYQVSCPPIFNGNLTGGAKGMVTQLSVMSKDEYQKIGINTQKGGDVISSSVSHLATLLAPVGKEALATVIVLLVLNLTSMKEKKKRKMKGGSLINSSIKVLAKTLFPMGKEQLLVLASLLLLNYLSQNNKKRVQYGGNMLLVEIGNLLAPAGKSMLASTALLVLLSDMLNKKKKRVHKGGNPFLAELSALIAPLGKVSLEVTAILVILQEIFNKKKKRKSKKGQSGGGLPFTVLFSELGKLLAPMGLEAFVATAGLGLLAKRKK